MSKKRTRLEIIKDILEVIKIRSGRIKPTHILYKSNLSHSMMEEYLSELKQKQFITELKKEKDSKKEQKTYAITEKGINYLSKYSIVADFAESFGLS